MQIKDNKIIIAFNPKFYDEKAINSSIKAFKDIVDVKLE